MDHTDKPKNPEMDYTDAPEIPRKDHTEIPQNPEEMERKGNKVALPDLITWMIQNLQIDFNLLTKLCKLLKKKYNCHSAESSDMDRIIRYLSIQYYQNIAIHYGMYFLLNDEDEDLPTSSECIARSIMERNARLKDKFIADVNQRILYCLNIDNFERLFKVFQNIFSLLQTQSVGTDKPYDYDIRLSLHEKANTQNKPPVPFNLRKYTGVGSMGRIDKVTIQAFTKEGWSRVHVIFLVYDGMLVLLDIARIFGIIYNGESAMTLRLPLNKTHTVKLGDVIMDIMVTESIDDQVASTSVASISINDKVELTSVVSTSVVSTSINDKVESTSVASTSVASTQIESHTD